MSGAKNAPRCATRCFPLLLGKTAAQVTNLPRGQLRPRSTTHILAFQTLLRPKDDRVLVMGGVAAARHGPGRQPCTPGSTWTISPTAPAWPRPQTRTPWSATPSSSQSTPMADIIWVVDESGSMNDNRQDIVNNANDFFTRAVKSGPRLPHGGGRRQEPRAAPASSVGKFCSKRQHRHQRRRRHRPLPQAHRADHLQVLRQQPALLRGRLGVRAGQRLRGGDHAPAAQARPQPTT